MRALALISILAGLVLVGAAGAGVPYVNYPNSLDPVWLSNDLIRFQTNLGTHTWTYEPYVVTPDGTGLRPATPEEAAAPPASLTPTSPDRRITVVHEVVGWTYADGSTLYAVPSDGSREPVRLTPTSCTIHPQYAGGSLRGRCLDGSDGADLLVGTVGGDVIIGGSGADTIRAGDGQNVIEAQWGEDDIRAGSGPDFVDAGDGNDTIRTGAGSDHIVPGPGDDIVYAGRGPDYVYANGGHRDVIDCGPGDDRVRADKIDVLRNCEHVYTAPPAPPPAIP
jgi:RTX calcium-binding nonapeptide repeat (4 copies)